MIPSTVALEEYLNPLDSFLKDESVSEIIINRPGFILLENKDGFHQHAVPKLDWRHLSGLADLIGRFSDQYLNETKPLLSGILPSGHRVQIVLPPAADRLIMAIRKQTLTDICLEDYVERDFFKNTKPFALKHTRIVSDHEEDSVLKELFKNQKYISFLKTAIVVKKNILISGATSTGKTTFLNACLKEIPSHEHIVTLEDVSEVKPPNSERHSGLLTSKGLQGTAEITMQDLVQASLRLRPDRIIMGEIRGAEASDFINATATGHDGSLSSIHAANPHMAFMRLVHMVKLSGTNLSREDILEDLHTVIDIVVQLKRHVREGKTIREVSSIYYQGSDV